MLPRSLVLPKKKTTDDRGINRLVIMPIIPDGRLSCAGEMRVISAALITPPTMCNAMIITCESASMSCGADDLCVCLGLVFFSLFHVFYFFRDLVDCFVSGNRFSVCLSVYLYVYLSASLFLSVCSSLFLQYNDLFYLNIKKILKKGIKNSLQRLFRT